MARQRKSKFLSFVTWVFILLLLIGCVGAILYFSGIKVDDIPDIVSPTFYVEYGEDVYKADTENIFVLPDSNQARFEVKGTNGYTVGIIPNVTGETDFTYSLNGKAYKFSSEKDLSFAFDLKCYDSAFMISITDYSLVGVLSKIWGVETVDIEKAIITNPYKIVVTSSRGETIELLFGGQNIYSSVPVLDKTEIVF